jgi:hypothetical protein
MFPQGLYFGLNAAMEEKRSVFLLMKMGYRFGGKDARNKMPTNEKSK